MKYQEEVSKSFEKLTTRPAKIEEEWLIFKCYITKALQNICGTKITGVST